MRDFAVHPRISETVTSWCNKCRLHAASIIIWNAEVDEIQKIIREAQSYLPAEIFEAEKLEVVRENCRSLSHDQLRAVRTYIELLLTSPCKTEECQSKCREHGDES